MNVSEMSTNEYIEHLEGALFDLLDGRYEWHEIRYVTGCSEERSKEIAEFFQQMKVMYGKKYNIKF